MPHDAGHILGATSLELTITENGKQTLVVFSGDVGRYDQPLLKDPETPVRADFLLCESTYGDREHEAGSVADELGNIVNATVKRGGAIVIPAFAVDRTQLLLYYLRQLEQQQKIPHLPVYVDSPMAINVTDIYNRHRADHDLKKQDVSDPLNLDNVHLTRTVEESKQINKVTRSVHHYFRERHGDGRSSAAPSGAKRLPDSRNTVLLVGYQAQGTGGQILQSGAKFLRLFGEQVPVKAQVVELGQLSAHAGKSELLRWLSGFKTPPKPDFSGAWRNQRADFAARRDQAQYQWPVTIPAYKQSFDLGAM